VRLQVLELDDSFSGLPNLPETEIHVPASKWGPQIRLACTFRTFGRFRHWLRDALPFTGHAVTFLGSGDFHHVTLALLERLSEPFNLLILDKHPDWMRGLPFLHCGSWLWHALRLRRLHRVFHCGGEADFDSAYRWLAPRRELRTGRVVVLPAQRRFTRGIWNRVSTSPLLVDGAFAADRLRKNLEPFLADLTSYPLYVSVDKDVLVSQDAVGNWDSGWLQLADALAVIETFRSVVRAPLIGADLTGDWSPVHLAGWINRGCEWFDRSNRPTGVANSAETNRTANAAFVNLLLRDLSREA
jgi:hypothetical protein